MEIHEVRTSTPARWAIALWGALTAVLTAPITAILLGVVYRFPIPFGDDARGVDEAGNAALASAYYLVKGEGVIVAALGGGAGYLLARATGPGLIRPLALAVATAFGLALLGAALLASW
ncbi:hypothetical protein DFR70_1011089 [Nocardia tenerifensis]|uniref:Uncharacterized protein n=1 Tax=Nocardia tenerifensis TaxID=228006 RepID=A0A318KFB2_9NOCA|nr:hypothetical protein [Nocardia tenerifensis]PXX71655.1 hypothetical protein DFR70_1011089 [Nocardia tenerifensis]